MPVIQLMGYDKPPLNGIRVMHGKSRDVRPGKYLDTSPLIWYFIDDPKKER